MLSKITVGDIEVRITDPYPCWVYMDQGKSTVSFRHDDIQIIIDILSLMKRKARNMLQDDGKKDEV